MQNRNPLALAMLLALTGCMGVYTQHQSGLAQLRAGMSREQVTSILGRPARVNRYASGALEQYVYNKPCMFGPVFQPLIYVYFRDGSMESFDELACP